VLVESEAKEQLQCELHSNQLMNKNNTGFYTMLKRPLIKIHLMPQVKIQVHQSQSAIQIVKNSLAQCENNAKSIKLTLAI
jgi:hypothetical protein